MAALAVKYPDLGERITRLMDEKGWTITQIAALAGSDGKGVTFATISRLRKGQTRPRAALLNRLAEIFEVSPIDIIGTDGLIPRNTGQSRERPFQAPAIVDSPCYADSLEGKMARIQSMRLQIAAAEALKPELALLVDEVTRELAKIKVETSVVA